MFPEGKRYKARHIVDGKIILTSEYSNELQSYQILLEEEED
jgi:hypothetical protein